MNRINSLGVVAVDTYQDQPWLGEEPTVPGTTTTTKKSLTDTLKDWFGVAKEGVEVYNTYKDGTIPGTMTTTSTPPPPPPSNNTAKYLKYGLAAAGVGLLAFVGYQALKGKKGK